MTLAGSGRRRASSLVLLAITIALGLASRRFASELPSFVARYAGDTLWASAAYWALGVASPGLAMRARATIALAIAVAVELSQLYHAPWLDAIRRTRPGAWLLGFGFLWSDLACYVVGVILAVAIDRALRRSRMRTG